MEPISIPKEKSKWKKLEKKKLWRKSIESSSRKIPNEKTA